NACTSGEACAAGQCTGGKPVACNDNNPCTADSCLPTSGCAHTAAAGQCDDGNGCTLDDTCQAGVCKPGTPLTCPDSYGACYAAKCTSTGAESHACGPTPKAAGTGCDDGKFCTAGDVCDGKGACAGSKPTDCSAKNAACLLGICDEVGKACTATPKADGTACSDTNSCTEGEACTAGVCSGGSQACPDVRVSTATPNLPGGGWPAPVTSALGKGRLRVAWTSASSELRMRSFAADGSREGNEIAISAGGDPIESVAGGADALNATLVWTTFLPFSTKKYCKCASPPGNVCSAASLFDAADTCYWYGAPSECLQVVQPGFTWHSGWNTLGSKYLDAVGANLSPATTVNCQVPAPQPVGYPSRAAMFARSPSGQMLQSLTTNGATSLMYSGIGSNWQWKIVNGIPLSTDGDLAAFADGSFALVWAQNGDIVAQLLTAAGAPAGPAFQVNDVTAGLQFEPRLAVLAGGQWAVTWTTDANAWDVQLKIFKAGGSEPVAKEACVHAGMWAGLQQRHARPVAWPDSGLLVAFESPDANGWGIWARSFDSNAVALHTPKQVNLGSDGHQMDVDAAVADAASAAVTWRGPDAHVYLRRIDKAGAIVPPPNRERRLNAAMVGVQNGPASAATPGGWTAVFQGPDASGIGIFLRTLDATGVPTGADVPVNLTTAGDQTVADIAANADGALAIAWASKNPATSSIDIVARAYAKDGSPVGGELSVNTTASGDQYRPVVAMQPSGHFAVAWESGAQPGGQNLDVVLRCYGPAGASPSAEVAVNTVVAGHQHWPSLGTWTDNSGVYVISWTQEDTATGDTDIWARRYAQDCKPLGEPFLVSANAAGAQSASRLAVQPGVGGGFAVVWRSVAAGGATDDVYGRTFTADGKPTSGDFVLNQQSANTENLPIPRYLPGGDLLVAWLTTAPVDGDASAIVMNRFKAGKPVGLEWVANVTGAGSQGYPRLSTRGDGTSLVTWHGTLDGDNIGSYCRVF
ncbi:MAG: hypothetical protein HY902_11760, partial [Deltaproteobacteria bacterium]|nr:hypothetical protein [Deltaproteobacteria bacterium]